MKAEDRINVAVVGLGWVATNRHIPLILRNPRLHLFGIVDKRPERIRLLTEKYPWLKTSLSEEGEMPWGEHVQAVLIATDPLNHFALAKKMLLAGKHVLMEKPLTMSLEESQELCRLAESTKRLCCVVHNFQFARSTLLLQEMIGQGKLGDILGIEAVQLSNPGRRLPTWYEKLPFGLFYDESPHMFYMLEAIGKGNLQHIDSTVIRLPKQNTPLSVSGQYICRSIPVRLNMNFRAPLSEWHIAVMGSKGIGIVDIFRDILVTMPNDGLHRAREILTSSGSFISSHLWGFAKSGLLLTRGNLFYGADHVWSRFVKCIEERDAAPEISTARGARIVSLQHELMDLSRKFELTANENSGNK
jgi:predicted dehydrogenase